MKLTSSIKEVIPLDEELSVGCLVKSAIDESVAGIVVEILSANEIIVLWNIPPKRKYSNREIW